jgi:hypothetical protein
MGMASAGADTGSGAVVARFLAAPAAAIASPGGGAGCDIGADMHRLVFV